MAKDKAHNANHPDDSAPPQSVEPPEPTGSVPPGDAPAAADTESDDDA